MSTTSIPSFTDARWDLSALFSGIDDPQIESSLNDLEERISEFASKHRGFFTKPDINAKQSVETIAVFESLINDLSKPLDYAYLLFAADASNPKNGAFLAQIQERVSNLMSRLLFFELDLQAADQNVIQQLLEDPVLSNYKHWIQHSRRMSNHKLSEVEEILLEKTANTGCRAWVRLFEDILSNHHFKLEKHHQDVVEDVSLEEVIATLRDPDRSLRQAAANALSNGLDELSRVLVFTYNNLLQDKKIEDELRKFQYPEESRHLSNELDKETVDVVIELCTENYPIVARFYNVKKEILGLDELTHIDRYAPLFEAKETIEYESAKDIVLDAFGSFSREMADKGKEFFDQSWIDAEPRPGKTGGAFCSYNTPDTHPVIMMSYLNKMNDVMTLAHELGHGVHASFSRKQTLFNYHGTLPLAELASTFGEMLVFDSIVKNATPKDKLSLYAEKIENIFATIFRQCAMYRFEQKCHHKRREDGELTADDFGTLWQESLQEMFGNSVTLGDQHRNWWSYVSHFIASPFYVYAYCFGELLVLSLYERAKTGGESFAEKYIELLKMGGSKTPAELMSMMDIDLRDPEFWKGGFSVVDRLVSEFESQWNSLKSTSQGDLA